MKVGCIQMRSGISVVENCSAMDALVRKAAGEGAKYVLTPEMTNLLEKNRKGLFASIQEEADDVVLKHALNLAAELGIWLHVGSVAVRAGEDKAANRAALFSPEGKCVATYDKIHMFDVDLDNGESWRESSVYQPGKVCHLVETARFRLGMAICYDIRFPELFRLQAQNGAEILTCPAAFTRQTGMAHWHALLKARAIENGAFVLAAAQGGDHEDGRETYGHSLVVNPWGGIIAEIENDEPGCLVAEIDLEEVAAARQKIPNLGNVQKFGFESLKVAGNAKIGEPV